MTATGESYAIYQNLHRLCKFRGARVTSRVIDSADHIAQMDSLHYAQITAERDASDVRGAAHIMIAQLANGHSIETKSDLFQRFLDRFIRAQKKDAIETNIIVITSLDISPNVRAKIDATNANARATPDVSPLFIEHVLAARVRIVVPEHIAVPEHTIVPREDVERICAELHIARADFPRIVASGDKPDAMAVWLGLRPGMVVRIKRISSATGYSIAYRACT
jgi:DNA-directed RNA polymerase subunit H (RpoH/RPB5)